MNSSAMDDIIQLKTELRIIKSFMRTYGERADKQVMPQKLT